MSKSKKTHLTLTSVVAGTLTEVLLTYFFGGILYEYINGSALLNILSTFIQWLLMYGVMSFFGYMCYGKDKRLLRFPLAFAISREIGVTVYIFLKIIFADLLSSVVYIDSSYLMLASTIAAAVICFAVLSAFTKKDALFYDVNAENEADPSFTALRNKKVYGENAYVKIITLVFGISFAVMRLGIIFGYNIFGNLFLDSVSEAMFNLPFDVLDLIISVAAFGICFLLSRSTCENKMGALYMTALLYFVNAVGQQLDYIIRPTVIGLISGIINGFYGIFGTLVSYIPTYIGDIFAIVVAVLIVRALTVSKK